MSSVDSAAMGALAMQRLSALQPGAPPPHMFTSDLSIDEYALVEDAGYEPAGFVAGISVYHMGLQWGSWGVNAEIPEMTQALYDMRHHAMSRMRAEAGQLGADGVIGVRLDIAAHSRTHMEFTALGTAIRSRGGRRLHLPDGGPFTSDLSGQDFYRLVVSGCRPLGLVLGTCVYHVAHQGIGAFMRRMGQNQEMPNYTQALYAARELAMTRLQSEAEALGGDGVVAMRIDEMSHQGWGSHVIEFLAVGTAVHTGEATTDVLRPSLVLPVDTP